MKSVFAKMVVVTSQRLVLYVVQQVRLINLLLVILHVHAFLSSFNSFSLFFSSLLPFLNGAKLEGYLCTCDGPFTGINCELPIPPCEYFKPCGDTMECVDEADGSFSCHQPCIGTCTC